MRVAHALKNLPKINAAFEKGELSYSRVRAMTRIADNENEDFLMRTARHGTAYHMEKLVQKYRRATRLQDVEHANQQHRNRYVKYHYDKHVCLVISARLPAAKPASTTWCSHIVTTTAWRTKAAMVASARSRATSCSRRRINCQSLAIVT